MLIYRCIFGGNTPGIWVVEGKIGTRVNTPTFYKFFNGQKRARIRLSFTCEPRNREVFELQTVLQSVREFARSLLTGWTDKKFVRTHGVILCGPCKEHTEMVLFNKSSPRILPVYQILVNPMNGFILTALVNSPLPYGNAKWQRWDHQLESLLSKNYFVRWLSWPLCGIKCPLRTLIQLFVLQQATSSARS